MTNDEHKEFLHDLYRVVTPMKYAYSDALRRGVQKERLAVGMTRDLFLKLQMNTNSTVYDDGSIFLCPLMVGSRYEEGASLLGLPVVIIGAGDEKCWLMEEVDIFPKKEETEVDNAELQSNSQKVSP